MNAKLIGAMTVLLIAGACVAFFLWSVIDEILSGHIEPMRDLAALAVTLIFAVLALWIGRWTRAIEP